MSWHAPITGGILGGIAEGGTNRCPQPPGDAPCTLPATRTKGREQIRVPFTHVEKALEDKGWLVGNRFNIADAYLGVFLGWAERQQLLNALPSLKVYLRAIAPVRRCKWPWLTKPDYCDNQRCTVLEFPPLPDH